MRTPHHKTSITAASVMLLLAGAPALAQQWDMVAGSYHTHLIFHADRFELHLHDKATHGMIDTTKGRYTATLLSGGRTTAVPVTASKSGIITGRPVPTGEWVLMFRVESPGRAPTQVRYSSKMKPGARAADAKAAKEDKGHDGHAHRHGH